MKRGSIVGPLILIGLGTLFLIRNVWPEIPIREFLAQNWPYLLIGWGVLRLVELFSWQASGKPLPASGVSGGEWFLIVFLCLFGAGLHQYSRLDRGGWWNSPRIRVGSWDVLGDNFDFNYAPKPVKAASKTPKVIIESFRGDAQITGADTDEVRVSGRKSVRALEQAEADRADQSTPIEVVTQGDQVIIRCNQDRADSRVRVTSRLDIVVPRGASIDARGRLGDFDIRDVNGTVEVSSDNAGVRIDNVGGDVRVDLRRSDIIRAVGVKGNVELKGRGDDVELDNIQGTVAVNGAYSGTVEFRNLAKGVRYEGINTDFQFEKVPGEIRSTIGGLVANRVSGAVRVKSSKAKDVQLSDFSGPVEVELDRGDVELRPGRTPLAKMDVSTRSGEVQLAIPDAAKFDLRASTERGEISNDYGDALKFESMGSRGQRLTGQVGQGPVLTIRSGRGGITIRKGDLLPPMPPVSPVAPPAPPAAPKPATPPTLRVE